MTRQAARVGRLLEEWGLSVDGEPTQGTSSLLLPVRAEDDVAAVLKVGAPHLPPGNEHLALQRWGGRGAVRMLRADPARRALLLERLHARDLRAVRDLEACEIVAGLYRQLHVPAPPTFPRLADHAAEWAVALAELPRGAALPRRLVEQAASLATDLAGDPASSGIVVHGDLHYGHVLAGDREPWLAVGPQPWSGDPHVEVAPLLWHRWSELTGGVREGVRRRFHTVVDTAGLDEERARDWAVVRAVREAALAEPARGGGGDWLTRCISIAKAVQD